MDLDGKTENMFYSRAFARMQPYKTKVLSNIDLFTCRKRVTYISHSQKYTS